MIRIIKDRDTLRLIEINGSVVTLKLPTSAELARLRLDHTQAGPVGGAPSLLSSYFNALEELAIKNIEPFGDEDGDRAFTTADVQFLDEITEGAILRFLGSPGDLNQLVKDAAGVYREPKPPSSEVIVAAIMAESPAPGAPDESAEKKDSGVGSAPV
jgi:hypothetical protein